MAVLEDATKPEEWDDEEDGDWIAPTVPNPKCADAAGCGEWKRFVKTKNHLPQCLIDWLSSPFKANPAYKGKWYAPQIDNPAYKGVWAPRKIPNPAYFEDLTPVKSLAKIVRLFHWIGFIEVLMWYRAVLVLNSGP